MKKKIKIPKTDSIRELAEFWDTQDLTDFEGELEEITEPAFDIDPTIKIRLESRDAEAVRQIAKASGLSREELIRKWVLQQLANQNGGNQA